MADKRIYDMSPEEAVDFINSEVAVFIDDFNEGKLTHSYFSSIDWNDERLYDLYFAFKVILGDEKYSVGIKLGYEKPFELIEREFNRRIGVDPEKGATAINL